MRLLADDASTWIRWLAARPPVLVPGQPVRDDVLTPVVYDAEAAARRAGEGKGGKAAAEAGKKRRAREGGEL